MDTHNVGNICNFCFRPSTKFYQSEHCIEPPIHAHFGGITELREALKKIFKNDLTEESKDACARCNDEFQQIYTFMNCCSENVLPSVENTVSSNNGVGQSNQLSTLLRREDHSESIDTKYCEGTFNDREFLNGSQIYKLKKMKKVVIRLKRLKMLTFAINVKSESDDNFCCIPGYSRAENECGTSTCEANLKDSRIDACPEIQDIKSEILEDIHTEDYQVIETSKASKSLVVLKDQRLYARKRIKCDLCDAGFGSRADLRWHKSKEHKNERYKCVQCKKDFPSITALHSHQKLHAGSIFDCDLCRAQFSTKEYLRKHKCRMHSGFKVKFKCEQCDKNFTDLQSLKRHLLRHQNVTFPCEFCEAKFRQKGTLLYHRRLHTGETFNCSHCDKRFTRQIILQKHYEKIHSTSDEDSLKFLETFSFDLREKTAIEKNFKCDQCNKSFDKKVLLNTHKLRMHTNKRYQCDHCQRKFKEISNLEKHLLMHQNEFLKCDQCGKELDTIFNLKQHKEMHSNRNTCEQCKKVFKTSRGLSLHNLSHHQNVTFPCDMCNKEFRSKNALSTHRRFHTGATFDCQQCDKRFVQRCILQRHITKIHQKIDRPTNEVLKHRFNRNDKRFKCDQCNNYYSSSTTLKRHILIHQNVTFSCDLCDQKFSQKGNMLQHRRFHTGETVNCNQCGQKFIRNDFLQKHLRICKKNIQKWDLISSVKTG